MKKRMKILVLVFVAVVSILLIGCDENKNRYGVDDYDNIAPQPPTNIKSVTGDNRVDISWSHNTERDLAGYNVYFSWTYDGRYELIGNTEENYFIDWDAENGETYYYAVTAYDYDGNESELSYDVVYDTPRPEGFNQSIFDFQKFPQNAGYSFKNYLVVPFNDDRADFFFENFDGTFYLNVWEDTDIQLAGYTNDIYDIDFAPTSGWVPIVGDDNVKYVEAEVGATYVIWTWDNHYAKLRISQITNDRMVFDWAYQLVEGERQLKTSRLTNVRNSVPQIVKSGK